MGRKVDWRIRAKKIMFDQEITVLELAHRMRRSPQNIYQLLDRANPRVDVLEAVAKALRCKVTDLVGMI